MRYIGPRSSEFEAMELAKRLAAVQRSALVGRCAQEPGTFLAKAETRKRGKLTTEQTMAVMSEAASISPKRRRRRFHVYERLAIGARTRQWQDETGTRQRG